MCHGQAECVTTSGSNRGLRSWAAGAAAARGTHAAQEEVVQHVVEVTQSETVGETVEPMDDEGDEGDDGGGSDVAVDDDGDDDDDGGDEEALLATAQLSPERLTYIESEYGLPGTGSQEERAEAGVEVLRAQSAKLRKKKNGKISKDAKDRRNMQNAWRRVDSYQTEGGK